MSYDIYYSIRENKKTRHEIDTLFFGKKMVYDYKCVLESHIIFDTYDEAFNYIVDKKLKNVHIRKHISTSSCYRYFDYIKR